MAYKFTLIDDVCVYNQDANNVLFFHGRSHIVYVLYFQHFHHLKQLQLQFQLHRPEENVQSLLKNQCISKKFQLHGIYSMKTKVNIALNTLTRTYKKMNVSQMTIRF